MNSRIICFKLISELIFKPKTTVEGVARGYYSFIMFLRHNFGVYFLPNLEN